jgi:hypothetical protein
MLGPLTARVAAAAVAVVVAGCGATSAPEARPSPPGPSAAELVRDAQEALRAAGTGHYEHTDLVLPDTGEWVPWSQVVGDYDLTRRTSTGEQRLSPAEDPRVTGWTHTAFVIATAGVEYMTSDQWLPLEGRKWHRVQRKLEGAADSPYFEIGTPPSVSAVLAFRPDGTEPDVDPDGWTVPGTLPIRVALSAVGARSEEAGPADPQLLTATGTAEARLVLGADRRVRELRVAGVDVDVTSELAASTRELLSRQLATITVSAQGKPVTVRMPPGEQVTDDPLPPLTPGGWW